MDSENIIEGFHKWGYPKMVDLYLMENPINDLGVPKPSYIFSFFRVGSGSGQQLETFTKSSKVTRKWRPPAGNGVKCSSCTWTGCFWFHTVING